MIRLPDGNLGTYSNTGSPVRSAPFAASYITADAVRGFVTEPIRYTVSGLLAVFSSRLAQS
ncbi:hypothetical protein ABH899_005563 [Paenibacillus sp. RC84]